MREDLAALVTYPRLLRLTHHDSDLNGKCSWQVGDSEADMLTYGDYNKAGSRDGGRGVSL